MAENIFCPYCGNLMSYYPYETAMKKWGVYRCEKCMAYAPHGSDADNDCDAQKSARIAASRRVEPVNHVLSKEELLDIRSKPIWIEHRCGNWTSAGWQILRKYAHDKLHLHSSTIGTINLGITWRCWLREPTEEERRYTSWEAL